MSQANAGKIIMTTEISTITILFFFAQEEDLLHLFPSPPAPATTASPKASESDSLAARLLSSFLGMRSGEAAAGGAVDPDLADSRQKENCAFVAHFDFSYFFKFRFKLTYDRVEKPYNFSITEGWYEKSRIFVIRFVFEYLLNLPTPPQAP